MKQITQALIAGVLLLAGTQAYAATYYFSTSGNNTTGNGTQASPFYSLCGPWPGAPCTTGTSKLSLGQIAVNPGDQFLFERGKQWTGWDAVWTLNATGAANNPLTFGAYGDPNLPRPMFQEAKTAFDLGKDTWTNVIGTPIWYTTGITWWPNVTAQEDTAPDGPALYGAWSVQGVTNANGWTSNQSMVRGTYFYDSTTQRLYVWRTDNLKPDHAAGRDIFIGGSTVDGTNRLIKVNRPSGVAGSNYVFQDLHAKLSSGYGFSTSYPNTTYINCLSELNSMEGFLFDRRRFGAPLPGAKDGVMRNCISRRNNLKQGTGTGQGISIEAENVWIYDSESYENAWAGVDFLDYDANTKTDGSGIVNSKIHNNGIQPVSQDCYDANIYVDGGSNITIQNCQIWGAGVDPRGVKTRNKPNPGISIDLEGPAFAAGKRPTNVKVLSTLSYGNMGPAITVGQINGSQTAVKALSNIQLIGNTFSRERGDNDILGFTDPSFIDTGIRPIRFANILSGLVLKNNIVVGMNTARSLLWGDKTMYDLGKSVMDFDYNIYYCPGCNFNVNGSGLFSYSYSQNLTIDQFRNLGAQASLRQDETLSKTVITSNPMLTDLNTATFDAHLASNSPALDIALTSAYPVVLSGTTRADGAADSPYNDLGYHYTLSAAAPPPPPADTQAPTIPAGLTAVQSGVDIVLAWSGSTDNVGVTGYQVFNGASLLGTSTSLSYTIPNAAAGNYTFTVKAFDAANNISSASNAVPFTVVAGADTIAPSAPTGITVTWVGGNSATVSWTASTDNVGVTGYQGYLYDATYGSVTTGTSFTLAPLYQNTGYLFRVKAKDAAGNWSALTSTNWLLMPTLVLAAPTGFTASQVSGQAQLSWNASPNATGYNVYRNNVFLKSVTTTSTTDATAAPGATYQYKVNASAAANNVSAFTASVNVTIPAAPTDTQPPTVPSGLAAVQAVTNILLSWTPSTDNVAVMGYKVFDGAVQLATSLSTNFTLQNPPVGSAHNFSVQAYDAAGNNSSPSNNVTLTVGPLPDTAAPTAPLGLTAVQSGADVLLNWTASTDDTGVTGYQIFDGGIMMGNTAATTYTVVNAAIATYNFTVKAVDAAGNVSVPSNTVTLAVAPPPDTTAPAAPSGLNAVQTGADVNLSWTASTDNVGVTGYQIFDGAIMMATSTSTTYTVTNAAIATYNFSVKAVDAANNISSASNVVTFAVAPPPDTIAPTAPSGLTAVQSGPDILLSWTAASDNVGVTVYQIFDGAILLGTTAATNFTLSNAAVATYSFSVKAADAANNISAASNVVTFTVTVPDTTAPVAPSGLVAALSGSTANLTWAASTDNVAVTGYQIFEGAVQKGTTASLTYSVSALSAGSHTFTVKAADAAGNISSDSNAATVNVVDTTPPTIPSGMTVTWVGGNSAVIAWNASTDNVGVTGYQGYLYDATYGGVTTATNFTVTNLYQTTGYLFRVKAMDAAGNSSSQLSSGWLLMPTLVLAAPTGFTASQVSGQAQLSWNASPNATGYNVYRNNVFLKSVTTTSTFDNAVTPGTTYQYKVNASAAANNVSAFSATASVAIPGGAVDTTAPSTPANLAASLAGTTANLTWSASTDNVAVTGYQVFQGAILKGTTASTSYSAAGLTQGQSFSFTVKAYDAANNVSAASNTATVNVPAAADTTAPSAPTSLSASASGSTANLTWAASTDNVAVTGYQIFEGAVQKGTTASLTYSVTNLSIGSHTFTVKAADAAGNVSAASNSATMTVSDTTAPSAPAGLLASLVGSTANLVWSASTDNVAVTGYQVFQDATMKTVTTALNFAASGLIQGQTYSFSVKAVDAANNVSASSNLVSVTVPDTTAPSAPASLSASASGSTANLTWAASTDNVAVSSYQVFEGAVLKGTTSLASYSVSNLSIGSHTFTVKAADAAGNVSAASNAATMTVSDTTAPSAPSGLLASLSGTTASLSWNASTDNVAVTGYRIFDGAAQIGTTTSLLYSASGLSVATHTFTVKAVDAANNLSAASNAATVTVASTAPGTPTNLIAYLSGNSVSVAWSSAINAAGYAVYRNGAFLVNVTTTSMTDSNVTAGQTYSYQVLAFNSAGVNSGFSNSMSVTVPAAEPAPPAPTDFRLSAGSNGEISISWTASPGATGYYLYRNDVLFMTLAGTSASDHPGSGTWRYKLQAYNGGGTSPFTVEKTARTLR